MTDAPHRPIPESYWVEPGRFLAGEYPGLRYDEAQTRQRLTAFLNAGFDTFIDLTTENERQPYFSMLSEEAEYEGREIRHRRFSFPDFHVPSHEMMVATLDALDAALAEGRKVYLHCVGGIGRTGMTVGCYLVRRGKTGEQALRQLAEWWQAVPKRAHFPRSPETDTQEQFIRDWKD